MSDNNHCDWCEHRGDDLTPDEDNTWWCPECIKAWEAMNQADWCTGQPKPIKSDE